MQIIKILTISSSLIILPAIAFTLDNGLITMIAGFMHGYLAGWISVEAFSK